MAARYWTCRHCQVRLPRRNPKCPECGAARPTRPTAAQRALKDAYEIWKARTEGLAFAHFTCGRLSCQKYWDQPHTDLSSPGWNVCPHCNFAAPTNVDQAFAAAVAGSTGGAS